MKKYACVFLFILIFLFNTTSAHANMIWPSLYIVSEMMTWWIILAGVIIEFVFVKLFTKDSYLKSVLMTIAMNAISVLVGIIAIPLSGILGELILLPIDVIFNLGTFHISHWIFAFLLIVLCNSSIEALSLKLIFKKPFKKIFWWLSCANIFSVLICALTMSFNYYV